MFAPLNVKSTSRHRSRGISIFVPMTKHAARADAFARVAEKRIALNYRKGLSSIAQTCLLSTKATASSSRAIRSAYRSASACNTRASVHEQHGRESAMSLFRPVEQCLHEDSVSYFRFLASPPRARDSRYRRPKACNAIDYDR